MLDLDLWPDVAPLLDDALDLDEPGRAEYVDAVADGAVREELRRYLRYAAEDGATTLGDLFGRKPLTGLPEGAVVGPYRLGPLLGAGGAGAVYRALDVRAEKEVALKVLVAPDAPDHADRLSREVRALGRLDNPAIARYLGAGETAVDDGDGGAERVLWIAMELVDGEPVTSFADREELGEGARVRLLVQACTAVQHALGRAVLHRDLKPPNVMARRDDAGRPTVKVIDFGVGRLLDEDAEGPTPPSSFRLTPAYAAPEQLRGEPATAATDVWGLGLVGRELVPDATGDLAAVLARACRPDPDDRYPDAGALRDDLDRVLSTRPVAARGGGAVYRAARFVQRRWGVVLSTALALAAAALALALVVRAQTQAAVESDRASEVTALLTAAFEETDPLRGGDPALMGEVAERVERALGGQPLRSDAAWEVQMLLGSAYGAAGDYERAFERQSDALTLARDAYGAGDARVAEVLRRLGVVEAARGRYSEADARFDEALAVLSATPDPGVEREVLASQGQFLREVGRAEEAKRVLRRAHRLCRRQLGEAPQCYGPLQGVAGVLVQQTDSLRAAEALYREAHAAYQRAYGDDDFRTTAALSNRATALAELGEYPLAVRLQRRATAAVERQLGEVHPATVVTKGLLATTLAQVGETDPEAMAEAQGLLAEQVAYHRGRGTGTVSLARALNNLGAATAGKGAEPDWASSVPHHEEALAVLSRAGVGDGHALVATTHNNLAVSLMRMGEYDRAEPHFQRSLALRQRRVGPDHPDIGFFLMTYAQQLSYRGDRAASEETIDRAIRVLGDALGPEHPEVGMAMMVKGTLLIRWDRQAEGMAVGREGARIRKAATGQ